MSINGLLTFEDGNVVLDGTLLPGILISLSIRNAVRYDEAKSDSMSGKAKVPLGWEDASVSLTLDLLTDADGDCYDKLTAINRIFKGANKKAGPKIYTVTGRHLRARGISRVVFDSLDSDEDDQDDTITVTLQFVEHLPPVIKREKRANAKKKTTGKASATASAPQTKATPSASPTIVKDSTNPFTAGFNTGSK